MDAYPEITLEAVFAHFDITTYERGYQYYLSKRVEHFHLYQENTYQWFLRSKVVGSKLYTQHIDIIQIGRGKYRLDTDCTCPVGYRCKHSVAALIAFINSNIYTPKSEAEQWRDSLLELAQKQTGTTGKHDAPSSDNGYTTIVRLFMDPSSDFEYRRAKRLKNGTMSKGKKITCDTMSYNIRYDYRVDYLPPSVRPLIQQLIPLDTSTYQNPSCRFMDEYGYTMLQKIVKSGIGYYKDHTTPLHYDATTRPLDFHWEKGAERYTLRSTLPPKVHLVSTTLPPMGIDPDADLLYPIDTPYTAEQLAMFLSAPTLPLETIVEIAQNLSTSQESLPFPLPDDLQFETIKTPPTPALYLYSEREGNSMVSMIDFLYLYGDHEIAPFPFAREEKLFAGETLLKILRDEDAELEYRTTLESMEMTYAPAYRTYFPQTDQDEDPTEIWRRFLDEHLPALREAGWQIDIAESFGLRFEYADTITVEEVDHEGLNPWFELSFHVTVAGQELPLLPIIASLLTRYDSPEALPEKLNVEMAPGHFLHLPSQEIAPLFATLLELFDAQTGETLIVHPHDAHLVRFDDRHSVRWKGLEELKALSEKLRNFDGIKTIPPSPNFQATLRGYQQTGLSWLYFLHTFRFGGILADDMGLGKTVQTLALLDRLKHEGELTAPTLIVMPTSLLGNWKNEIETFTPNLTYLQLYGTDRAEKFAQMGEYDILLTTYQLAQRDAEHYQGYAFAYLILDEAQKIKNPTTKMAVAIKSFTAAHRLALSGTPIENHLGELWSIFDFVMPGFLEDLRSFRVLYQNPIEKEHDLRRSERLHRKVRPFILRRTKEAVALELPAKTEIVKRAAFDPKQAALYENIRIAMEQKVRDAVATKGLARSHITILDALLKLRQVCCHPQLLKLKAAQKVHHSTKLDLFLELLDELMSEGRKVLVFSQFTSMLSILEKEIKRRKIPYTKLTGATRKRDEVIERFTTGKADVFLISLKAGGVGLNLVAADTVIHYDPWWNPAVENQATDRAYRIGQDKPVFVYKLIVENSIEEKILELQEKKQAIQDGIYGSKDDEQEGIFNGEELLSLLKMDT